MAAMAAEPSSSPSSSRPGASFEVEAEADDIPLAGGAVRPPGPVRRAVKRCGEGGPAVMVACVFAGAIFGLIVNVSVSEREVLSFVLVSREVCRG